MMCGCIRRNVRSFRASEAIVFKSVLVPLTGFDSDKPALESAYMAGRLFNAHIEGLWVRPKPAHFTASAVESHFVNTAYAAAFVAEDELRTKTARIAFSEFCEHRQVTHADAPGPNEVSVASREITGDAVETTIAQSRFHDLVVLGRAPFASHLSTGGIGAVLVSSGRPVLLAPEHTPETLGATIAIAWKDTPEAARALAVSMAFLERANKTVVLGADEHSAKTAAAAESAERIATLLRWNGLKAEAHYVAPDGQTLPEAVLGAAGARGADMLVMGAYGHSRARELVFGGFTRAVLTSCQLPVLLFH
jgi:nucleotide-binding universal stress UspA family protein